MGRRLVSSAVAGSRLGWFVDVVGERFDNVDLSPILIYLYDIVDESVIPWLAAQLDVDGFRGLDLCADVAQKRNLLKNAIELHRSMGTNSSLMKAFGIIGLSDGDFVIEENVPIVAGGKKVWCAFKVHLSESALIKLGDNSFSELKKFINYYKNERSILVDVYITRSVSDSIFISNEQDRDILYVVENQYLGDFYKDFSDDFYN